MKFTYPLIRGAILMLMYASSVELFAHVLSDEVRNFICATHNWFVEAGTPPSPALDVCMKQITSGCTEVEATLLYDAIPDMITFADMRANRPDDADTIGDNDDFASQKIIDFLLKLLCELNSCCEILQEDFRETWTMIDAIVTQTLQVDLSGVYTTLNQIDNDLNLCCSTLQQDFQYTWTILNQIISDQAGTFTVLVDIKNSFTDQCGATPITTVTIINTPGNYCLAQSITSDSVIITINSNDVVIDLNGYFIAGSTGVAISTSNTNVVIRNGTIKNTTDAGIDIGIGANSITIENVLFLSCDTAALRFEGQNSACVVDGVSIVEPLTTGIIATDITGIEIRNSSITGANAANGFTAIYFTGSNANILLSNNYIANIRGSNADTFGINCENAIGTLFQDLVIEGVTAVSSGNAYGIRDNESQIQYENCLVSGIAAAAGNTATGFYFIASKNQVVDCTATNIAAGTAYGFELTTLDNTALVGCSVFNANGSIAAIGIDLTATLSCLIENAVIENTSTGIFASGSNDVIRGAIVKNCSNSGIILNTAPIIVDSCTATNCISFGITDLEGTNTVTNCYASGNGSNYSGIATTYAVGASTLAGYNLSA